MPQGKGTYGSKKGRPPKKMNRGGMTPTRKRDFFNSPNRPTQIAEIQEGLRQVRPGMKGGGTVATPKMMSRGGATATAERKALGVGSIGKEVMEKLGLIGAGAGAGAGVVTGSGVGVGSGAGVGSLTAAGLPALGIVPTAVR